MTKTRALSAALILGPALVLSACTPDDPAPADPSDTGTATSAAVTAAPDAGAETEQATATAEAVGPAPVTCEDLPREPTEQEQAWLIEPGPYVGESYDQAAAMAAAQALQPQTDEEWAEAIVAQVHGDYAETICDMIRFSPDLGDGQAAPTAASPEIESVGQNHFALVLDSSGSMAADAGGATRMEAAKDALETFAGTLPDNATVSLRLYGHKGANTQEGKAESCASSEVVYEGAPDGMGSVLDAVQPVGYTPLAKAIADSAGDIPEDSDEAVVYVVTDGLESCGGDPVQAAGDVAAAGVEPIINVIGFQVGDSDQAALAAIAKAGGGEFSTPDSAEELRQFWREEEELLRKAWREWRDSEQERIVTTSQERFDTIWQDYLTLREAVTQDRRNGLAIVAELRRQGSFDQARQQSIGTLVEDHFDGIREYGNDFRGNIQTVVGNLHGDLDDLYSESGTTWQDFYDRKQDGSR